MNYGRLERQFRIQATAYGETLILNRIVSHASMYLYVGYAVKHDTPPPPPSAQFKQSVYIVFLLAGYEGCYNMNAESLQRFVYRHSHLILTHCIMYCWHRRTTFAVTKVTPAPNDPQWATEPTQLTLVTRAENHPQRLVSYFTTHRTHFY